MQLKNYENNLATYHSSQLLWNMDTAIEYYAFKGIKGILHFLFLGIKIYISFKYWLLTVEKSGKLEPFFK